MCSTYPPNAIPKLFCFPGLVLTTAGFILAGVSQSEWSLSRDFGRTGCARPHSAANQISSVLPVPMKSGSGGLLGMFHAPLSNLSWSTAILLFKCFAEECCYSLEPTCLRLCVLKCINRSVLLGWWKAFMVNVVGCAWRPAFHLFACLFWCSWLLMHQCLLIQSVTPCISLFMDCKSNAKSSDDITSKSWLDHCSVYYFVLWTLSCCWSLL